MLDWTRLQDDGMRHLIASSARNRNELVELVFSYGVHLSVPRRKGGLALSVRFIALKTVACQITSRCYHRRYEPSINAGIALDVPPIWGLSVALANCPRDSVFGKDE